MMDDASMWILILIDSDSLWKKKHWIVNHVNICEPAHVELQQKKIFNEPAHVYVLI
jgi:hypothetical protein